LRLVGGWQTQSSGEFADLVLGQTGFFERGPDLKLGGGGGSRAVIAEIGSVFSVGNDPETFGLGDGFKLCKQRVFAEIAAIDGIREVVGIVEFRGAGNADGDVEPSGNVQGLLQLSAREAGRICDHSEGSGTQDLIRHGREQDRIHSARIRHQATLVTGEHFFETAQFDIQHGRSFARAWQDCRARLVRT